MYSLINQFSVGVSCCKISRNISLSPSVHQRTRQFRFHSGKNQYFRLKLAIGGLTQNTHWLWGDVAVKRLIFFFPPLNYRNNPVLLLISVTLAVCSSLPSTESWACSAPPSFRQCRIIVNMWLQREKTVSPVLRNVSVGAAFLGVDILRALLLISLSCGSVLFVGVFGAAWYSSL